jgi:hypothetical protein
MQERPGQTGASIGAGLEIPAPSVKPGTRPISCFPLTTCFLLSTGVDVMTLIKNVGKTDRNIRLAAGGVLVFLGIVTNTVLFSILGLIVLATGAVGTCPAYMVLKMDTTKNDKA